MSGIYIHIPFCKQACTYCDFHFSTSPKLMKPVVDGIVREAEIRSEYLQAPVETIYFGGGTPSFLPEEFIDKILTAARKNFEVSADPEITLEANPDDICTDRVSQWRRSGINRLSIGIQSFQDRYLKWMNRAHNAEEALKATTVAIEAGITNLSIDMIYGLPDMDAKLWDRELERAVNTGAGHISAYCLTVEPRTVLGHRVKGGTEKPVDEDAAAEQFEIMVQKLPHAGFEQYEVSNFAKPGMESRHNSNYWRGVPYLGLGPAAHGFNGRERYWNASNNARYIAAIEKGELPQTTESLTDEDRYNEWVMTGLRTREGIRISEAKKQFNRDMVAMHGERMKHLTKQGLAKWEGDILRLTPKGLFLADGIAGEFFLNC